MDIDKIKIVHYLHSDGFVLYSGTIYYNDGDISATTCYTPGKLSEFFIDNLVPFEIWNNCKVIKNEVL